jgi:hypothetical protein
MISRGWYLCAGDPDAHYFNTATEPRPPLCCKPLERGAAWNIAQDIERVRLCELCKGEIRGGR